MASTKNKKKANNSGYRKKEPYQRQASVDNAASRIAMGLLFVILGVITAVSYFNQDGTLIAEIRKFMSGILGYGFWALAVCFIWVAIIIFQANDHSGIRILCILLIPILFSAFIDLLSYKTPVSYGQTDVASQANALFVNGQNFKCGGVISGLLVRWMVHLLSKIGTGLVICIVLIICVAMAVSEPQGWYGKSSKKPSGSGKNSKNGSANGKNKVLASASGVGTTLGMLWSGESGKAARSGNGRFDPSSLIRINDEADCSYDVYDVSSEEENVPDDNTVDPDFSLEEEELPIPMELPVNKRRKYNSGEPDDFSGLHSPARNAKTADHADRRTMADSEGLTKKTFRSNVGRDGSEISPIEIRKDSAGRQRRKNTSEFPNPERTEVTSDLAASQVREERTKGKRSPADAEQMYSGYNETGKQRAFDAQRSPEERGGPQRPTGEKRPTACDREKIRTAASTGSDIKEQKQVTAKEARTAAKSIANQISKAGGEDYSEYEFPPTALLRAAESAGSDSEVEIRENRQRLEIALHSFGVNSNVVKTTHGPTVTRYDIELEQGVKLTKVTNLSNDLALALGVTSVRIAPIPDEISTVGIEVPNKIVNTVSLKELVESENFRNAKSKLSFAIGKDIGGNAIIGNISKLPHMLIAGTTGSGKSVCMNSLILSLLYKARPDEVKLIMIDPKMVELGIYNSIPHLYVPVVTEPKKAAGALQWSVVEMLKRYRLFSEVGTRDLEGYNSHCRNNGDQPLPQVVIVIDELADLMMAASKEVEESICRIAQMGRAAGMHLVIATQRPSADVITGLMKANIPSRIAFAVSSALESRIILDQGGADKLIGHGDMLYAPIGCGKPLRVQGSFVSDEEREKIIRFISTHSTFVPETNDEINQFMDKAMEGKNGSSDSNTTPSAGNGKKGGVPDGYDEMLPDAVEVVLEMKSCSVSMLQRRIKLGYSRAARIVDQMEELGVVGPYEGAKPRSVIISREDWQILKSEKLGISGSDDYAVAAEMNE